MTRSDPTTTARATLHAALHALAADEAAGKVRSLADYLAAFPGHDALLTTELTPLLDPTAGRDHRPCIGPYRLERELGRGGQAVVWLAHDLRLQRDVALKVLPRLASADQEQRLQREATTAARLDDPGICPVYEVDRDGDHLYLVMKFVPGETLAQRLAGSPGGGLPLAEVVALFERLARTLHRAHAAGIVHRDLKPANVMIGPDGQPVLLDFGLAIAVDDQSPTLTRSGDVFGTPHYLPPERLDGRRRAGDAQGDLWAFGVTLFEALTGRRPFEAPTLERVYHAVLHNEPPDLRQWQPEAPRDLAAVLGTLLEKDLDRRYRSAAAVADDLRAVLAKEPVQARPPGPWRRALRWHRRHAVAATAGWLVLAGLLSTITVQQRALQEVRAAEAETAGLNEFLVEKLLLATTPDETRGQDVSAATVFDKALRNVGQTFTTASRTRGTLYHVLGQAYHALGRDQQALSALRQAIADRTALHGADARETLRSRLEYIRALRQSDAQAAEAERLLAATMPVMVRQLGADDRDTLGARLDQVRMTIRAGRYEEAEQQARAVAADWVRAHGRGDRVTLAALHLHARTLELRGRRTEAEPQMRDVLKARQELLGADAPAVADSLNDLASLLHDLALRDGVERAWPEAGTCYQQALQLAERLHGKPSVPYATSLNNLASFLQDRARAAADLTLLDQAIERFRESLAMREALHGEESIRVANAATNLGIALLDRAVHAEGLGLLERGLRIRERLQGELHPESIRALSNLLTGRRRATDIAGALELLPELRRRLAAAPDLDRKSRLFYEFGMVALRSSAGQHGAAVAEGTPLYAACLEEWPGGGPTGTRLAETLAASHRALGNLAEAAAWQQKAATR